MTDAPGDQVSRFEDRRWATKEQVPVWRHHVAAELVIEEPVLDLGGGDGLFLQLLSERGFRDVSLGDVSPVAVERVRAKGFRADIVDVTRDLPYADAQFATVCALDVLEHLYDPLAALREMSRVGRRVVIVVPNFNYWRERLDMVVGRTPFQSRPQRGHVYWFNRSSLRALVTEAGLDVEAERLSPPIRLGKAGRLLAKARPDLFASAIAVRVRPR